MIDTMKPYPEYKDSGLPWLGCIPQHWEVRRNGRLFMQRNSTGYGHLPILEVSLKTGVRVRNMDKLKRKQVISDRNKYKWAAKGDIAYNMMRMWQGAVGVASVDGLVSPAYVVVRPRSEVEPRYFSYLFRTDIYKKEVDGFSRGIVKDRNRLYWEDFKRIPSCFPSLAEQKIIADYLDVNSVKVRRFIRNRRRLIEVLNEQKHGIINQAVTLGLDSDVPRKPSGIDWLGEVPEHWNILPFTKYAIERADYRGATPEKVDSGIFLVTAKNIRKGWIDYEVSKEFVRTEDFSVIMRRGLPQCDDLLLTMEAPLGHIALVDREDIALAQRLVRFRMNTDHFMPKFVLHSALSAYFQNQMLCRGTGSTAIGIKASKLPQLRILQPSLKEQAEIVAKIDRVSAPLLDAIAKAQSEIDLIREYRTRLISDVVIGKIDVRHLAPSVGSEDLEEATEVLEPFEDVMADAEIDNEENVHESD